MIHFSNCGLNKEEKHNGHSEHRL